jgi:hypothetical protein
METSNVITLLGNHDLMAYKAMSGVNMERWFRNCGKETMEAFVAAGDSFIKKYMQWIPKLPINCEYTYTADARIFFISHAGVDLVAYELHEKIDPAEVAKSMNTNEAVWTRYVEMLVNRPDVQKKLTKTLVFGHTPTYCFDRAYGGRIFTAENVICIDCGTAYRKKWSRLGCIRLDDLREFYVPCMDAEQ